MQDDPGTDESRVLDQHTPTVMCQCQCKLRWRSPRVRMAPATPRDGALLGLLGSSVVGRPGVWAPATPRDGASLGFLGPLPPLEIVHRWHCVPECCDCSLVSIRGQMVGVCTLAGGAVVGAFAGMLLLCRSAWVPMITCGLPERCWSRSLVLPRVSCGLPER
jgi:hypothetical protein